jgi:hypothetical protein
LWYASNIGGCERFGLEQPPLIFEQNRQFNAVAPMKYLCPSHHSSHCQQRHFAIGNKVSGLAMPPESPERITIEDAEQIWQSIRTDPRAWHSCNR